MSKEKDSLILYESFFEATQELSVSDKGEIWQALHAYISGKEEYEFTSITAKLAWNFIKLQLNADAKKWQETCKRRSEAGKRGNQKRWNKTDQKEESIANAIFAINENRKASQSIAKKTFAINEIANIADTDTESESDTDIFIDNKNNSYPTKDKILKLAKDPSVALSPDEAEEEKNIKKEKLLNESAERIWQAYPKKDGKKEGIKAIIKRLKEGLKEEYLIDRVKAYAICVQNEEKRFIKHAQGWFNGERYLDPSLDNPTSKTNHPCISLADFKRKFNAIYDYNGTDIDEDSTDYIDKMILFVRKLQSVDDFKNKYPNEYANITNRINRKDK